MARETSIQAFNTIKENGLLSERRWRVYEILFKHGPMIGSQVAEAYREIYGRTSNSETVRNRLTELRDMGCVAEMGKTIDEKTGMSVIQWDVTKRVPVKVDKSKHKCPTCKGKGFLKSTQTRFDF